ncbi:unnamed protein product [Rotaria sordida]|uniref:Metalloendopeptidase n=1 Tax=Rotaria sordida TaxID=392033 RepID=A0A819N1Z1_9BILA|nr:unnamed protein product [Rotaria sordida]
MLIRNIFIFLILIYSASSFPKYRTVADTNIPDPEEIGGDFEGDIFLTPTTIFRGIGKREPSARWPNGIVPYEISSDYDGYDRAKIISAMRRLERIVSLDPISASYCIRFQPKTADDKYFISIRNGSGCSSYVGRVNEGGQRVTLQMKSYCVDREATVMHEFMHALGFWHEQSRPDRDDYITIDFNNVQSGKEHNFNKYSFEVTDTLNLPYDYNSVMHYSKTAFSMNGRPTIITKDPDVWIGQRNSLSATDIEEIRKYYDCT